MVLVYAGCVYWPFHWSPTLGAGIGGGILVLGTIQAFVTLVRGLVGEAEA
ncbi:MAG: hypothetical protein JRI25_19765 [Deltaproteobacteria bacterium]|nr:hypothetical protein [Deltaproteobacteria bacterium]